MIDPRALRSVAEDIEWLQQSWAGDPDALSDADVRRGAGTLRRLLLERGQGAILAAWREIGFAGQPTVVGPDLLSLLQQLGHPLEHVGSAVAGGAPIGGVVTVAFGMHRVEHPETGVPPEADEGFAVKLSSLSRIVPREGEDPPSSDYDANVNRKWRLTDYLDAPGAVRHGHPIRRRNIIQFFCKEVGGVHVDGLFSSKSARNHCELLAAELDCKVHAEPRRGLVWELLSIGYALGTSDDLAELASAIRRREAAEADRSAEKPSRLGLRRS